MLTGIWATFLLNREGTQSDDQHLAVHLVALIYKVKDGQSRPLLFGKKAELINYRINANFAHF